MKIQKKNIFFWGGEGGEGQGGVQGGGRGGCELRGEAFVKIQKKYIYFFWGVGGRVRGVSGWMGTEN